MGANHPILVQGEDMMVVYAATHCADGGTVFKLGNTNTPEYGAVTAAEGLDFFIDCKCTKLIVCIGKHAHTGLLLYVSKGTDGIITNIKYLRTRNYEWPEPYFLSDSFLIIC